MGDAVEEGKVESLADFGEALLARLHEAKAEVQKMLPEGDDAGVGDPVAVLEGLRLTAAQIEEAACDIAELAEEIQNAYVALINARPTPDSAPEPEPEPEIEVPAEPEPVATGDPNDTACDETPVSGAYSTQIE